MSSGNYLEKVSTEIEGLVVSNPVVPFIRTYPTECVHMLTKNIHENICSSTVHNIANLETHVYRGKWMINCGTFIHEMLQSNENEKIYLHSICSSYKCYTKFSSFIWFCELFLLCSKNHGLFLSS